MRYSVIFRPENKGSISIGSYVANIHEGKVTLQLSPNTEFYIEYEDESGVLIGKYKMQYLIHELPVMFIPETHPLFNCYIVSKTISNLKLIRHSVIGAPLLELYRSVLFKSERNNQDEI